MAFGKGGTFPAGTKVYSFNLKDKDLPAPIFDVLTKKEGEEKSVKVDTANRISGRLTGTKHKEFKKDGKTITSITATIEDGNEVYFVSIPYTYLGRNIMNSLASLADSFDGIEISVYKGKPKEPKEGQPAKPGFSSSAIRQAGQLVYGKYEHKDLPAIPKVKVGGNTFGDTTAIDALFQKEMIELDKRIKSKAPVVANEEAAPSGAGTPESGGHPTEDTSDIPF